MELTLNARELCDLELLLNGGFAPLTGYMNEADYTSVVETLHLSTGELWPMPITLSVSPEQAESLRSGDQIILKDEFNYPVANLEVDDVYKPDLDNECLKVYGTNDDNHPYVKIVMENPDVYYVGGKVELIEYPRHYDFLDIRLTPEETREYFKKQGWKNIIGFQTRNPMHRSHYELTLNSVKEVEAEVGKNVHIMLHPVVGVTQPCDVNYHTRVNCYKELMNYYPDGLAKLSLLPLAMRMAGPREAMWHALIRKNYGCTHFVVGRDHAGPSYKTKEGGSFYGPYDAHDLLEKYSDELGIKIIKSVFIVYVESLDKYFKIDEVPEGHEVTNISGTEQRRLLSEGLDIPEWFSFPGVVKELRKEYRPLRRQGFCVHASGLSGSGKTTTIQALNQRLLEMNDKRKITILDADVVRQNLSKGLGFSKEDRSTNVRRIGYVASEIVKHGGICLIANIAPYDSDRKHNQDLIEAYGGYFQVYVKTSLKICEDRDVKGLYQKARDGIIKGFTGISDPYEEPLDADIIIDGDGDIGQNVEKILAAIRKAGYIE